jgi:hypothetical protein
MMSRIDSRHWTISTGRHFQNGHHNTTKIQHCPINRTMLNLCGIVVAILKMATSGNFSMSGIISGHHNLPTYDTTKIQHCPISSKFDMWIDNDVPNWFLTSKNRTNSTLFDFNDISYVGRLFRKNFHSIESKAFSNSTNNKIWL